MVRIAVIGAGPAGLIAAKNALSEGHEVTVFEQEEANGGIWLYSNETDKHSAMYDKLLTNIPKQMMALRGKPYDDELPSFLPRQEVLRYFRNYAEGIPVELNTKVVEVERKGSDWKVTTAHSGKVSESHFDVVFVCSGHHFKPKSPLAHSYFKGRYLHSRDYRVPSEFEGKRVALIGAGYSGIDIALQLISFASKVFLIGNHAIYGKVPEEITLVPSQVEEVGTTSITLENGEIMRDIDVIIDCRGYEWNYPFFSENIVQTRHNGRMVTPIWMYFVHRDYPKSLFFIGLNDQTLQLRIMEMEVQFALSLISDRIPVLSKEEMENWEKQRLRYLEEEDRTPEFFHILVKEQFAHIDNLCRMGRLPPMEDREAVEKLDQYVDKQRWLDPAGYKKIEFIWDGSEYKPIRKDQLPN